MTSYGFIILTFALAVIISTEGMIRYNENMIWL